MGRNQEDSSNENSPSGYIPVSSISLYNFLLNLTHFSIGIPLSPSINTFTLLVGFIRTDTQKYSFSSASISLISCSNCCKCTSFDILKKEKGAVAAPFLLYFFCKCSKLWVNSQIFPSNPLMLRIKPYCRPKLGGYFGVF